VSAYLVSFHDALRVTIGAAWSETKANGIYRDVELARNTSLQTKAEAAQFPFAVFSLDLSEGDWGLTNHAHEGTLTVLYVADDSVSLDAMIAKLEALRDQLWPQANLTVGQVLDYPRVVESVASPALNEFLSAVQRPFLAGGVQCRVVVGEQA
jgi:hypothetical protein